MSQVQQIELELPEELYSEIENLTEEEKDMLFREALQEQIQQKKSAELRNEMKQGYLEMAQINAEISNEFAAAEEEALQTGERAILAAE
ncbi:hypothetical protein [Alteribacillus iranensis]|uniref:CopG family transcriptional regulator / antitoxin EndoAI n=1 Tax=Alteribacillus iranensis TaxID=930128 RepID=A0A1I1ZVY0_9BACI|nr:hypothetical protein [Alteribacillus iranensis]SFE35727.1 CopG family transcriptional regulator / antitoxin EndoAI [Alteribacillus iranensis]